MALCRNKWHVRAVERIRQTTIAKTTRTAAVIHGYLSLVGDICGCNRSGLEPIGLTGGKQKGGPLECILGLQSGGDPVKDMVGL